VTALRERDRALALATMQRDYEIDTKEKEIAGQCVSLLLLQQPVASDLRIVTAASRIIADMERIGDYAADVSEVVLSMDGRDYLSCLDEIDSMAEAAVKMLGESVDAYIRQDMELVNTVRAGDDEVDALFMKARERLSDMLQSRAGSGRYAADLIMIAKYFERIADHSVNIANWTEFCRDGYYKNSKII
jgi:phosphate transport system protein